MAEGSNDDVKSLLSCILSELNSLKREVQGTNQTVASEVEKIRSEKDIHWKFVGNKSQFDFNTEISDIVKQALWATEHGKTEYCVDQLNEVVEKLHKRNKHVRIADTSTGGWDTVNQYEANPIASDSDDESKIFRAENRALKKKKARRGRGSSRPSVPAATAPNPWTQQSESRSILPPPLGRGKLFRGQRSAVNAGSGFIGSYGPAPGPCFACGEISHFRRDCPFIKPRDAAAATPSGK